MLLLVYAATTAAVGPMSYLRPYDMAKDDLRKLQEQVDKDKAAARGEPILPEADADEEESGGGEEGEAATAAPSSSSSGSGLRLPLALLTRPLPLALGAGAAFAGHRILSGAQLNAQINQELAALKEMTGSRSAVEAPAGGKRAALEDLRKRKELLGSRVLPLLAQLEQPADAPSLGKPLSTCSVEELDELQSALSARASACGKLLSEYEALGCQPPPPKFRSWPLEKVEAHLALFAAKGDELRSVASLLSRLGGPRVEGDLPTMEVTQLQEYAASLEGKVAEAEKRKEKDILLGKVEAELWRRKEEPPVALATLSTSKLRKLLKHLKSGGEVASAMDA